jgi:outer membrane protein OmpA-like peptidoglycan-associated protein
MIRPLRAAAWPVLALALAIVCAVPASGASLGRTLHPLSRQTTDQAIASDLALFDAWRAKLDALPGAVRDPWRREAAIAWLEVARQEYGDNDRTGFPQTALARAIALVEAIEHGEKPLTFETVPAGPTAPRTLPVAESLYVELERMKHDPSFLCAAEELARCEMQLAWAANERLDQGDCQVAPHLAAARALARAAAAKMERCAAVPSPLARPKVAMADTVPVPPVSLPTVEELKIPMNVHFALNRFDITPGSRHIIEDIAVLLAKYPSITVHLVGHTDSRGDSVYNLRLSERRVLAVSGVLHGLGVDSTRLSVAYRGKADPTAAEDSRRGFALNRRVEMSFMDPEGRDVRGVVQEGDLQVESGAAPHPKPAAPRRRAGKVMAPRDSTTGSPR